MINDSINPRNRTEEIAFRWALFCWSQHFELVQPVFSLPLCPIILPIFHYFVYDFYLRSYKISYWNQGKHSLFSLCPLNQTSHCRWLSDWHTFSPEVLIWDISITSLSLLCLEVFFGKICSITPQRLRWDWPVHPHFCPSWRYFLQSLETSPDCHSFFRDDWQCPCSEIIRLPQHSWGDSIRSQRLVYFELSSFTCSLTWFSSTKG